MSNLLDLGSGVLLTASGYVAAVVVFVVQSLTIRKVQLENGKLILETVRITEEIEKLRHEREQREKPTSVIHSLTPEERDRYIPKPFERAPTSYRGPLITVAVVLFGASLFQLAHEGQQAGIAANDAESKLAQAAAAASAAATSAGRLAAQNEELRKLVPIPSLPLDQLRTCDEAKVRLRSEVEKRKDEWLKDSSSTGRTCAGSCHVSIENGKVTFTLDNFPGAVPNVVRDIQVGSLTCAPFALSLKK